jgi:hypothetical protein
MQRSATYYIFRVSKYNLFSITKLQNDGWMLGENADAIWLTKEDIEIKFDIKILTPKGVLYAMYHQCNTEIAAPTVATPNAGAASVEAIIPTPKRMLVKKAHDMIGNINEKAVRKTAIALGWELTCVTLDMCAPCTDAKAKQKIFQGIQMHRHLPKTKIVSAWASQRSRKPRKDRKSIKGTGELWWMNEFNCNFLTSWTPKQAWWKKPANNYIVGKQADEQLRSSDLIMPVKKAVAAKIAKCLPKYLIQGIHQGM